MVDDSLHPVPHSVIVCCIGVCGSEDREHEVLLPSRKTEGIRAVGDGVALDLEDELEAFDAG